jgi:sec-independent protein translocase protein TatB
MFDVGFWELCLIAVVSLLVIGPEKLPKLARIAGFWVGKTRHIVASVKAIRWEINGCSTSSFSDI